MSDADDIESDSEGDLGDSIRHPINAEGRAHQCHHDGCDSPCVWDVYLHIRYGWHHVATESLKSTVRVCDKHKKHANDFILSEYNKKIISRRLATIGRLAIDWPNAMIEFVPCGEISWGPSRMVPLQVGRA
jgi:hypothetical protein